MGSRTGVASGIGARCPDVEPRTGRTVGATTAAFAPGWASGSLLDVEYPPGADYDTHAHGSFYLALIVRGRFREWRPAPRDVPPTALVEYAPDSRHAVRVGRGQLRILHLVTQERDGVRWSEELPGLLWQMARELERARPRRDADSDLVLESLLAEALAQDRAAEGPGRDPSWLGAVRERLRDPSIGSVGLRDLAALAGVHPSHLARTFRARHGMTAGEFLRRLRVARALREVQSGGRSLSHIALDAGFADQSHFGRFFRRYVGTTPARLRSLLPRG